MVGIIIICIMLAALDSWVKNPQNKYYITPKHW